MLSIRAPRLKKSTRFVHYAMNFMGPARAGYCDSGESHMAAFRRASTVVKNHQHFQPVPLDLALLREIRPVLLLVKCGCPSLSGRMQTVSIAHVWKTSLSMLQGEASGTAPHKAPVTRVCAGARVAHDRRT